MKFGKWPATSLDCTEVQFKGLEMHATTTVSAINFMGNQPHFIMWMVEGSDRTWCACYPQDNIPFALTQIEGNVDQQGIFRALDLEVAMNDGLKVRTVVIERDVELGIDESMEETVIIRGRNKTT